MRWGDMGCAALVAAALLGSVGGAAAQATQINMWSNWPDEPAKKDWVTARVRAFETANPQCSVKLSFIPKADIYTQAKSAVRTGQAPDIFYLEPDQPEFLAGGFLEPLDDYIGPCGPGRLGQARLDLQGQGLWPAGGGLYGRALLQQGSGEESRRGCAGLVPAHPGAIHRSGEEGRRRRHHPHLPGRGRPAVPRRADHTGMRTDGPRVNDAGDPCRSLRIAVVGAEKNLQASRKIYR